MAKKLNNFVIGIVFAIALVAVIYIYWPNCAETKTGWVCSFNSQTTADIYEQKCENSGGRWECPGYCFANYQHYCDFPFDDVGKECTNSDQCDGSCIMNYTEVTQNYQNSKIYFTNETYYSKINCTGICKGTCTKYPATDLGGEWFEINDSVIIVRGGMYID